jgi:hypothetical protein
MRNFFSRLFSALRSAFSWMEGQWDWMSHTAFGRGCGYCWTAAKLPVAFAAATVGIELINGRDLDRMGSAAGAVGRAGANVGSSVAGAASLATKGVGAVVSDIVGLPKSLWRSVFGGGGAPSMPDQAAAQAAARASAEQAKADDAADDRVVLAALRRVASSVSKGARPAASDLEDLPAGMAGYVVQLSPDEAEILARARTKALRMLMGSGVAPDGVRSPKELAADLKASTSTVVVPNQVLQARIDAKRAEAEAELAAVRRVA